MALLHPFTVNLTPHAACVAPEQTRPSQQVKSITAKRMISGLVLKYLNGECFVIRRGYETSPARLKLVLSDSANAAAISSDKFKAVITGDPVTAKIIYKEPVEFKPRAMHILSTNVLPSFKGGIDAGIERRLLVIPFSRTIPVEERISDFETKLMKEQGDILISEAIREAAIVFKNGHYSVPASCQEATTQWMKEADTVRNWLEDGGLRRAVPKRDAKLFNEVYIYFRKDMDEVGIKYIPGLPRFNSKIREFIANDPSWEEVRHSDGKKIQRSNLVTRMTGNS